MARTDALRRSAELALSVAAIFLRAPALVHFTMQSAVKVVQMSGSPTAYGMVCHANVVFNGRDGSRVSGTVYVVTEAELAAADEFEKPFAYARTAVTLASAQEAWVYVHAPARIA